MKISNFRKGLVVLLLLASSIVKAQDPVAAIANSLSKFTTARNQEKVHLHLDKPYYAAGDTIWFKAYTIAAATNTSSDLSQTLNINVVNDKDSIVFVKKIPLKAGLGNGDIALPLSLKKGSYVVYAFTNWMRNFDNDFFFKQTIQVENPFEEKKAILPAQKASASVLTFFPEGGDLVEGIRSKVAFKCIDGNGFGKATTGYILNKSNEKIIEFETNTLGMGLFALSPLANEVYTAVYMDGATEVKTKFPEVKPQGYVLAVNMIDTLNLSVKITISPQLANGKELLLIAQSNGVINYASKIAAQQVISTSIPKDKFPTGILQLTLFNSENQPLAERLVFINHKDHLKINVNANKQEYKKREPVELKLAIANKENKSGFGSYSIAVTDDTKVPFKEDDQNSILSDILLTSDLKGFVEKPAYYFNTKVADAAKHLDYLMLTQGWRRFKWSEVLQNTEPQFAFKLEKGIDISGKVTTNSGSPIAGGKVILFSGKAAIFSTDTLTNQKGEFAFDEIGFSDSTSFGLQARNINDKKNVKVVLNQNPIPKFNVSQALTGTVSYDLTNFIANSKSQYEEVYKYNQDKEIQLKQIEIKGVKKIPEIERSSNLNGPGMADKVITAEQLTGSTGLFEYLTNYVNGVLLQDDSIYFSRNMATISSEGPAPVQFVLNGTFVTQDFIRDMNVGEIQNVEVLKSAAYTSIYGLSGGFGGVILVTTKQGKNRPVSQYAPGIITFMPKGYDITKEFYSPKYSPTINPTKPDLRSTIYWNANVITDKEGKATLKYFNADGVGTYKVVVEGINADGQIGRSVYTYTVK